MGDSCRGRLLRETAGDRIISFSGCEVMNMQTKLVEEKKEELKPEYDLKLYCTQCGMDPGESYAAVWAFGKLRPLLTAVTFTILLCPRCKTPYYRRGFLAKSGRIRERLPPCKHCGSRRIRFDKRRQELFCVMCGLVAEQ